LNSVDCIIGSQIPEFEATTLEGASIDRESLKGRFSIINFWFISCPPCVAEIPGFNAIVDKLGTNEINYVAIGRDEHLDIQEFLERNPWKFEQIADGSHLIESVFHIRWGFPTTFLLNKEAEIIHAFYGGKTDSTAIQEIQDKLVPILEREMQ
jgi:peroxiredoxin